MRPLDSGEEFRAYKLFDIAALPLKHMRSHRQGLEIGLFQVLKRLSMLADHNEVFHPYVYSNNARKLYLEGCE